MSANWEDFQEYNFSDPDAARAWADEADLTPAQRRRVKAWVKEWDSELGQGHVEHLNNHSEAIKKEYKSLVESLDADCREAAGVPALLSNGRITSKEATKRLAQLARNRQSYLKILAAVNGSIKNWESSADAEPTERLHELQDRFASGAPRYGRRSLTAKVLRGEDR